MIATITGDIHLKGTIPVSLLRTIELENRFENPEYVKKHAFGRWKGDVDRYLSTCLRSAEGWSLPRGYGQRLHALAQIHGTPVKWQDRRVTSYTAFPGSLIGVTLRPYQLSALTATDRATQGTIIAPTGSGKTVMGLELIRRKGQRAMILVHSNDLAEQWRGVIRERLGIEAGMVGGGRFRPGEEITIAMLQTLLQRPEEARQLYSGIGLTLVDECHHIPAATFARVIARIPSRFRFGLTATPERKDGLHGMITYLLGPKLTEIPPEVVQEAGGIIPAVVRVIPTGCHFPQLDAVATATWNDFLDALIKDKTRNALIAEQARQASASWPTLILTDRVEHAETLGRLLPGSVVAHGGLKARKRAMTDMKLARITVGTVGLLGEGLDHSGWGCLVIACPMGGGARLTQAVGRVIRPAPGKGEGVVIDLVDRHPFALGSFYKRKRTYNARKWKIESTLPPAPPPPLPSRRATTAIDLGTQMGWAHTSGGGRLVSGSVDLTSRRFEGGGMRYLSFEAWLLNHLDQLKPGLVVFEEVRAHAGVDAAHVYGGLRATLTKELERRKIPYRSIPVGTWKRVVANRGNADKGAVMAAVRRLGHAPKSQDEADAIGILLAAEEVIS